ncbi:MAG: dihydrodipicolinate reductase, partial [Bdellovibrionales bacterium]|nr:dihydrodipicolinate reductase [Bdellovibrionales bacterium]
MKIALIGKGKTGGQILKLSNQHQVEVFDSKNNVTVDKLKDIDVAIAFVDGKIFKQLIPILIKSKVPVVTGSTGLKWQENTDELLKENN